MRSTPRFVSAVVIVFLSTAISLAQDETDKKDSDLPDGLKSLRNPDPIVRYRAASVLVKLGSVGKFAIPELHERLKDENGFVRVKAAEALWVIERTSPEVLLPVLLAALKDKDGELRAAVPPVLSQLGAKAKAAVPALIRTLKDKDFNVQIEAVVALGEIGPAAHEAAAPLLAMCRDENIVLLEPALGAALANMGPRAAPELAKGLKDKEPACRRVAAYALGAMGPASREAISDLVGVLNDKEGVVRSLAARALGNMGKDARSGLKPLRTALSDAEPQVRISAAFAVWQIDGSTTDTLNVLSKALDDGDPTIRESAARAMGRLGAANKDAIPDLAKALLDKEGIVREAAALALGSIGPPAEKTQKSLRRLWQDDDIAVRQAAAFAFWQVTGQPKDCLELLKTTLTAKAVADRKRAVWYAGEIGPAAQPLFATLMQMWSEEESSLRAVLAAALKKIDAKAAARAGVR